MKAARFCALAIAACSRHSHAPREEPPAPDPGLHPELAVVDVSPGTLCVTKGTMSGARVDVPTFRAVAPGRGGDAAAARVLVRGASSDARALASGQERRQLGLKLRAGDGCNLLYVMWRLDPKPKLEVSVKRNPGKRTSRECGADGYAKVRPERALPPPVLEDGAAHELRAELRGDALLAWIDGHVVWEGTVPGSVAELAGPAGVRSDNLAFDLLAFSADARAGTTVEVKCADAEED